MTWTADTPEDADLHAALLRQPRTVLYPPVEQFSSGFGEAAWQAAMRASNEHLIPRGLVLGFQAAAAAGAPSAPVALQQALQRYANALDEDREVVAMVLQPGLLQALAPSRLGQLLDAVPRQLRTVARPQVEVRLQAADLVAPAQLRAVGCTRLNIIDDAAADGPARLRDAGGAGFSALYYQLCVPTSDDEGFIQRLHTVLELAPDRILLPAPPAAPRRPCPRRWLQAWRLVAQAGYRAVGGEHYQRADLGAAQGTGDGQRHCDLSGVPRRDRSDFLGIGPGACSQVGDVFLRLHADPRRWQQCLDAGHLGVAAGLITSQPERLAAEVVQSIACDHAVDVGAFEWRNERAFHACFPEAMAALAPMLEREWAYQDGAVLRLRAEGRLLWRMMAACFRPAAAIA